MSKNKQRSDKRERIIKVSLQLFARNGYDSTTIRMIANEAGISLGLLYNYFSGKNEVLKNGKSLPDKRKASQAPWNPAQAFMDFFKKLSGQTVTSAPSTSTAEKEHPEAQTHKAEKEETTHKEVIKMIRVCFISVELLQAASGRCW